MSFGAFVNSKPSWESSGFQALRFGGGDPRHAHLQPRPPASAYALLALLLLQGRAVHEDGRQADLQALHEAPEGAAGRAPARGARKGSPGTRCGPKRRKAPYVNTTCDAVKQPEYYWMRPEIQPC